MKPVIISKDKVLETLLKGHEVINVFFLNSGNVDCTQLTKKSIKSIKGILDDNDIQQFFVALVNELPDETPDDNTGNAPEEPKPEEPKEPEQTEEEKPEETPES